MKLKTENTQKKFVSISIIWGIIFSFLVLLFSFQGAHAAVKLIPVHLLKWHGKGNDYAILVDKSAQKIFVYHKDNRFKPVKTFRCSTGENNGPKSKKNDKKTPEGIYFCTKSYVKKELSSTYGIKAFPIDYPNQLDKKQGKSGYGIWFHGTNETLKPRDTNGCIVLENNSIKDLSRYIRLHETPVIITPKIDMIPDKNLKKESIRLEKLIKKWSRTWQNKEMGQYMDLYSQRFSSRGMDWKRWKEHKVRLANKYKKIHVSIDNLQLYEANDVVLARFDQTYSTELFESRGEKRLYFGKNSNEWRIIGEFFTEHKAVKKVPSFRPPTPFEEIKKLVHSWKKAWEEKNLRSYISFYDRDFRSDGMDLSAWKRRKARLNKKYSSVSIRISQLKIIKQSGRTALVRFKQGYRAGTYYDLGMKDLLLIRSGKDWKIKKETWHPL